MRDSDPAGMAPGAGLAATAHPLPNAAAMSSSVSAAPTAQAGGFAADPYGR